MASANNLDRRDFVKVILTFLGSIIGAVIALPAIGFLISPATKSKSGESWIPLGSLEDYPIDKPTLFTFTRTTVNGWEKSVNSVGVYVLRTSEDQCEVISNLCTHLSCRVSWKDDVKEFVCPCHDAHFDLHGQVCSGPPPSALIKFETKMEDGNLSLHFLEG